MPLRRKGSKVYAVTAPQRASEGRPSRAQAAPLTRRSSLGQPRLPATTDPTGLAFAVVIACAEVEAASAVELSSPSDEATRARQRAQRHKRDVRDRLRAKVGRDEERALVAGLHSDGGLALRTAASAGPALRPHLVRALLDAVQIAREQGIETKAARLLLVRGLSSLATAAYYSARFAAEADGGDLATLKLLGDLRDRADVQGRLNLTAALQLGREHRPAPVPVAFDFEARAREIEADQARALEERTRTGGPEDAPAAPEEGDDAPDDDDAPAGPQSARTGRPRPT